MTSPAAGRPRRGLSRQLVVETAYRMVEADGLAGLSMPRLGRRLGASTMSVYRHVRDKDDLLDAVTALALENQYAGWTPPADVPWDERARAEMRVARRFILDHPGLGELLVFRSRPHLEPGTLARLEARLGSLVEAGFEPDEAARIWIALRTFTWGHALWESARAGEYGEGWRRGLADAGAGAGIPILALAAGALADAVGDDQFELGLDLLLAGAAARAHQGQNGGMSVETRDVKAGGRFSRKAATPSLPSA